MCAKTQKIDNVCSPSKRDFLSWQMSGFQLDKCKEESNFLIQDFILAHPLFVAYNWSISLCL